MTNMRNHGMCQFLLGNVKQLNLLAFNDILPLLFHKIKPCA